MDASDLTKSLEQLETKKRDINVKSDLSGECKSIVELDQRLELLLREIKCLKNDVLEQSRFVEDKCDKLGPPYNILSQASQTFRITKELRKLNRLCLRIDNSEYFRNKLSQSLENPVISTTVTSSSTIQHGSPLEQQKATCLANGGNVVAEQSDEIGSTMVYELIESFETVYQTLESILSKRSDLPYVDYANRVRTIRVLLKGGPSESSNNTA